MVFALFKFNPQSTVETGDSQPIRTTRFLAELAKNGFR